MNNLSHYFKKFTNVVSHERVVSKRCIEAVSLYTGITISKEQLSVRNGVVFLTLHPTRKHHILQYREDILGYINNNPFRFSVTQLQ